VHGGLAFSKQARILRCYVDDFDIQLHVETIDFSDSKFDSFLGVSKKIKWRDEYYNPLARFGG
jgi:hypothetical protein